MRSARELSEVVSFSSSCHLHQLAQNPHISKVTHYLFLTYVHFRDLCLLMVLSYIQVPHKYYFKLSASNGVALVLK
jgi:hypothetical protein